jgi:hypothetical protein
MRRIAAMFATAIAISSCSGSGGTALSAVRPTSYSISSFGEDDDGELYVVDHNGAVYRFDPA